MTDDTRTGGARTDIFDGADGDDNLDGREGVDVIFGGSGDDTLTGGGGIDFLLGGGGADTIYGGTGDDWIRGGSGDDTIEGGEGNDIILGDAGDDTIDAGEGNDTIIDGGGDDTLTGGTGADTFAFLPGRGSDTITDFDTSDDQIDLSQFTMAITFTQLQAKMSTVTDPDNPDTVTGVQIDLSDFGGGTITLEGVTSTSTLTADMFSLPDCDGPLDDLLVTGPLMGDEHRSFYLGGTGDGTFTTLEGHDIVFSEEGDDTIYGGEGNDWLVGGEGADTIEGGAGIDDIYGGEGDDILKGGEDGDRLVGGAGDDTITGGAMDDFLIGDAGADTFVFASGDGNDTIIDFENGTDTIDLSAISSITGFSDLTITQEGDDTKIDLGENVGEIILEYFTSTDLDASDFEFSM